VGGCIIYLLLNNINSHEKYIIGAVFSLCILASPVLASASELTSTQIQSILSLLSSFGVDQSVISNVQVALNGGTPTSPCSQFCYNFNSNLSMGQNGSAVIALQTALQKDGESVSITSTFDEQTASVVTGFQQKYKNYILTPVGLQYGTGYVGSYTRAKLNALFGCQNSQKPSITVLSPNGGETWQVGNTYTIKWSGAGYDTYGGKPVDINLLSYVGPNNYPVVMTIAPSISNNFYNWVIPSSVNTGAYIVRISSAVTGEVISDLSDSYFKIVATGTPSITTTSPLPS